MRRDSSAGRALVGGVVVLLAVEGACGLDVVGRVLPGGVVEEGGVALHEGGTVDVGGADAANEAGGGGDRDATPGGCVAIVGGPGLLSVPRIASPTIDGDLADWPTCFVRLDAKNAGQVRVLEDAGGSPAGEFTVGHDGTKLYIAARMVGVPPLGNNGGPELYENDGIAVYVDADGMFTNLNNGYGTDAMQIVVDHAARAQGFRSTAQVAVTNASWKARVADGGTAFTIELALSPQTFGVGAFGSRIGFDIAWNDGVGNAQASEIVWFKKCGAADGCKCNNNDDAPYCESRQFGAAQLLP